MYSLLITDRALLQTQEAYLYYEAIRAGLGGIFLENLQERYTALSKNPELHSFSDEVRDIRDVAIQRFPFLVIYEILGDSVIILSVRSTYKKPYRFD